MNVRELIKELSIYQPFYNVKIKVLINSEVKTISDNVKSDIDCIYLSNSGDIIIEVKILTNSETVSDNEG